MKQTTIDMIKEGARMLVPHLGVLPLMAAIVLIYWTTDIDLFAVRAALLMAWGIGIIARVIAEGED